MTERMRIEDLRKYRWVSDPRISPSGEEVAYVVSEVNGDDSGYESHIWLVPCGGGAPRKLTSGGVDTMPRWSPDGRHLAFLSRREGDDNSLWIIPRDGGEARRVTPGIEGIRYYCWSPLGDRLAFTRIIGSAEMEGEGESSDDDDVVVIRTMSYKLNGRGFIHEEFSHVFVVDAGGGEAVRITDGPYDHVEPAWFPDGVHVACACTRAEDRGEIDHADILVFPADGSVPGGSTDPVCLTPGLGPASSPVVNASGTHVVYVGHDNEYYGATLPGLLVASVADGEVRAILDRDQEVGCAIGGDNRYGNYPEAPTWTRGDAEILFTTSHRGSCNIAAVDPADGRVRYLTGDKWAVTAFSYSDASDRVAFVAEDPAQPGEIWVLEPGGGPVRLTHHNAHLDAYDLPRPREIVYPGSEGAMIQGWILEPTGQGEENTPLVLQIHGGPHAAYGYAFNHEFHCLAARGFSVLYTNPHGSRGYGAAFNASTRHDWGGKDYRDLMAGVDFLLDEGGFDPDRLGVAGGSFGGFMTNWIVGHDDRFAAAVTQRSSCNRFSMFGTGDLGYNHGQWEFPGFPWDNPGEYLRLSPISYVDRVNTPMLIIHSENDLRCPMGQAEEWFTALKRLGKEAVFVRFPEENHELSRSGRPDRRIRRLELIVQWFEERIGAGRDIDPVTRA